jgi:hypothetical protein
VQIVDATERRLALVDRLAEQLMSKFGAPTRRRIAAAEEEITFAELLQPAVRYADRRASPI